MNLEVLVCKARIGCGAKRRICGRLHDCVATPPAPSDSRKCWPEETTKTGRAPGHCWMYRTCRDHPCSWRRRRGIPAAPPPRHGYEARPLLRFISLNFKISSTRPIEPIQLKNGNQTVHLLHLVQFECGQKRLNSNPVKNIRADSNLVRNVWEDLNPIKIFEPIRIALGSSVGLNLVRNVREDSNPIKNVWTSSNRTWFNRRFESGQKRSVVSNRACFQPSSELKTDKICCAWFSSLNWFEPNRSPTYVNPFIWNTSITIQLNGITQDLLILNSEKSKHNQVK